MSFIETERLFLRTWMIPGDLDAANAIFGDPDVMRYIPRPPVRPDEMPAYLERLNVITEHDPGLGLWPIVEKSSGAVVGDCGLVYIPSTMDVEIAWHLRRDAWGLYFSTFAWNASLRRAKYLAAFPLLAVTEAVRRAKAGP